MKGFTLKCRYHQMINRYNVISLKIPMVFTAEIGNAYSKIHRNNRFKMNYYLTDFIYSFESKWTWGVGGGWRGRTNKFQEEGGWRGRTAEQGTTCQALAQCMGSWPQLKAHAQRNNRGGS